MKVTNLDNPPATVDTADNLSNKNDANKAHAESILNKDIDIEAIKREGKTPELDNTNLSGQIPPNGPVPRSSIDTQPAMVKPLDQSNQYTGPLDNVAQQQSAGPNVNKQTPQNKTPSFQPLDPNVQNNDPKAKLADIQQFEKRGFKLLPLDLPSCHYFYPAEVRDIDQQQGLLVRDFDWDEYIMLAAARENGNAKMLFEAVGMTVYNIRWTDVIMGDFQSIMLYHRLRAKEGDTFTIQYECDNEDHIQAVIEKRAPEDSLRQTAIIGKSDFIVNRPKDHLKALECMEINTNLRLAPTTIGDFIELMEARKAVEAQANPNLTFAAIQNMSDTLDSYAQYSNYASMLNKCHGRTLNERVQYFTDFVKNTPRDQMFNIMRLFKKFKELSDCGVEEYVKVTCKHCQKEQEQSIQFEPLEQFLPAEFGDIGSIGF